MFQALDHALTHCNPTTNQRLYLIVGCDFVHWRYLWTCVVLLLQGESTLLIGDFRDGPECELTCLSPAATMKDLLPLSF